MVLKEIEELGIDWIIDKWATVIYQEDKFRKALKKFSSFNESLEFADERRAQLINNCLVGWRAEYLSANSHFRHLHHIKDQSFLIPSFIVKSDFDNYDVLLRVLAVNIANHLNDGAREFEEYKERLEKYPAGLNELHDTLFLMSLESVFSVASPKLGEFNDLIKSYCTTEYGTRWLQTFAQPLLAKIKGLTEVYYKDAIDTWYKMGDSYFPFYPIQSHYNTYVNGVVVANYMRDRYYESFEREFVELKSKAINQSFLIQEELNRIRNKYLNAPNASNGYLDNKFDPERYRRAMLSSPEEECGTSANFEKIVSWSKEKAAADFTTYLNDLMSSDTMTWTTQLTTAQISAVAKFLGRVGLFPSERQALLFVQTYFNHKDESGNVRAYNLNTLKNQRNNSLVKKLEKLFVKN